MSAIRSAVYSGRYRQLIREFPLRQLRGKSDADAATKILDRLFRDHYDDRGEAEYVYVLTQLLVEYEKHNDPVTSHASGLDVLRYLVQEHQLTQSQLAQILDVSQSAVSMILSGVRPITADHARRLGKKFAIDPGTFL
ncbi:MAG: helix-turn-helix domain-containing protein [Tepidisphaeraceae bacterium]|jgi:HTH-type transcriptional regulator/antitoxin HigA